MEIAWAIFCCGGILILILLYYSILKWIPIIFPASNLMLEADVKYIYLKKKFKPKNKKYNCQKIVEIEIIRPLYKSGTWKVLGYTKEEAKKKLDEAWADGFLPPPKPKPILISAILDKELDKLI